MTDRQSNATIKRDGLHWGEVAGLVALAGLTLLFLAFSWRKWPDPLIDFGREIYTPWRLANGAVLYRDVDCFYGPFSEYFNALIFTLFGPGLMVLVAANLIVFATIVTILYLLCRHAWGIISALAACAIFIVLFRVFTVCQHQQLQLRHTVFARGYARPVALFASDLRPFGIAETCDAASQFPRWNASWPHGLIKTGNLVRRRCRYDRCSH